jgi:glutathione S-transferase
VIVLRAKQIPFEVTYINLREKPEWFLAISPHGKVPVLAVDEQPLFESSAIAEYLDEVVPPRLHPEDPIKRARNRAWTDFVPDFASAIGGVYYSRSPEAMEAAMPLACQRIERLETALGQERDGDGPFFNGPEICLVDAAYAPFLQRFTLVEEKLGSGLLDGFPRVGGWRDALVADPRVSGSVPESFEVEFVKNLQRREAQAAALFG